MNWRKMLLMTGLGYQLDIQETREEIDEMRQRFSSERQTYVGETDAQRLARLEREVDELRLYVAALVRYLMAARALDPGKYRSFIADLDGPDPTVDGELPEAEKP